MYGHISGMAKPSNREKILTEGLKVVHARGFAGASVRDIVQAERLFRGEVVGERSLRNAGGLDDIAHTCAGEAARMHDLQTFSEDLFPV